MDETKWLDETIWPSNSPIDCNSLLSSRNVILIHCPICPFFTYNYKRLLEHLAVSAHTSTVECVFYRCNECNKVSTSSVLLKEHFFEEHPESGNKHSTPISCLGVQRFSKKKDTDCSIDGSTETQCLFCSYQGNDLSHHYSSEHNVLTGSHKLFKPTINSLLNMFNHHPVNSDLDPISNFKNETIDMKMSDGTLIVLPEEPIEDGINNGVDLANSFSVGSKRRKMCLPVAANGCIETENNESDDSESNSESFSNQFVSGSHHIVHDLYETSSVNFQKLSESFIDSHINNVIVTDDESSEHSSDLSRPFNGDGNSNASGTILNSTVNRGLHHMGNRMTRKRGRPPKIASQVLSKEEIEGELAPHIEIVGKGSDNKEMVRIASNEPYSVVVPFSLLISAFDTDGVQYLKNLIRFHYKPEQLALFAWDVTQKRGRPRTSITVCSDPNTNDVSSIALQSLRQEPFVQASMRLIERLFGQAFPANLPIFINRLLQSHRYYVYGTTGASSTTPAPSTNPLIYSDDASSPISGPMPAVSASPYKDAELRLSRFWIPCPNSDKNVMLSQNSPSIRKHMLICAYDPDPVRFFRNLVRSALPLEELLHATWKGKNTGRPRFISALPNDEQNDDQCDDKRPLIEHPLVQAFLEFVPKVCGRSLPENLGPIIHQLLATVRKSHSTNNNNNGVSNNMKTEAL